MKFFYVENYHRKVLQKCLYTKHLALLMLFMAISMAHAQKVKGAVLDTNDAAIPNVIVEVLNTSYSALTDSSGQFVVTLPNSGSYVLRFSSLGYAPTIIKLNLSNEEASLMVRMQEALTVLEEVVISANKIEESIVNVPSSITSLSAEKIRDTQTWKLDNMVGLVPNFQYADVGVGYQQQVALRGVSVFSENPTVATYVDGVNALDIASSGFQLTDVERIEILRGPQGTLYGRNAMAGVINIVTKKPTNKTTGFSELSVGNQGLQRYTAALKAPILKDKLFWGCTVQFQRMYGYHTSDTSEPIALMGHTLHGKAPVGIRLGDENSIYGNLSLRWLPSPKKELSFNSKAQYDYSTGPSSYYQASASDSLALAKPYRFTVNRFGSNKRLVWNNSLAYKHYFNHFTLTSVSAYQHVLQAYDNVDFDYSSFDMAYAASFHKKLGDFYPQRVFSQELRLNSVASRRLKWTAGTYFFFQSYHLRTATVYIAPLGALLGRQGTEVSQSDRGNTGIAGFGQVSYKIQKKLEITLGLRYDYEYKKALTAMFNLDGQSHRTYSHQETLKRKSYQAISPKAILSYLPKAHQHLYLSYARGYRAGGINMFTNLSGYEAYQPEHSDNFEVGYKTFSASKKYIWSTCLFLMDWKDLQLDYRPSGNNAWVTDNLGGVRSYGAEAELGLMLYRKLKIDISAGWNQAKYKDFEYAGEQIGGNRTILAPNITAMLAPQYTFTIAAKAKATMVLRAEWRYIGTQYFDLANTIKQAAYHRFNARIGVVFSRLECYMWGQNLSNVQFISYAAPAYFQYTLLGRPLAYGISLTAKL